MLIGFGLAGLCFIAAIVFAIGVNLPNSGISMSDVITYGAVGLVFLVAALLCWKSGGGCCGLN
jgi:ABC-type siderophore export system fused ATPase/permease subunit